HGRAAAPQTATVARRRAAAITWVRRVDPVMCGPPTTVWRTRCAVARMVEDSARRVIGMQYDGAFGRLRIGASCPSVRGEQRQGGADRRKVVGCPAARCRPCDLVVEEADGDSGQRSACRCDLREGVDAGL